MTYFLRNKQPLCKRECMNAWSFRRQVATNALSFLPTDFLKLGFERQKLLIKVVAFAHGCEEKF